MEQTFDITTEFEDWVFFYLSYSHRYNKMSVFLRFGESNEVLAVNEVKHFYTNYH
jgi:hypothetical protein